MFKKKKRNSCDAFSGIVFAINEHEAYEKAMRTVKPKKKFNINDYPGKYAMHCENSEELFRFYDYLHSVGRKWSNGSSYAKTRFTTNYVRFNEGSHCFIKPSDVTVLEFKDFDWSDSNMERKTKFKVGDKVKIVKVRGDHMGKVRCLGTTCTISSIDPNQMWSYRKLETHYGVRDTSGDLYVWFEDEIELVEEKPFTKADLKTGMVVEYRNGTKAVFINDIFMEKHGWMPISDYYDDLINVRDLSCSSHYDICRVYNSKAFAVDNLFKPECLELIWERKEVKKEPKYKVGDRVRVRSDLIADKEYDPPIITNNSMVHNYAGKSCFISEVDTTEKDGVVRYKLEGCCWYWTEGMFEGLVEYEEMTVAEIEKQLGYKVKIVDGE